MKQKKKEVEREIEKYKKDKFIKADKLANKKETYKSKTTDICTIYFSLVRREVQSGR